MSKKYFVAWRYFDPAGTVEGYGSGFVTLDEGDELNETFMQKLTDTLRKKADSADEVTRDVAITAFNPC